MQGQRQQPMGERIKVMIVRLLASRGRVSSLEHRSC